MIVIVDYGLGNLASISNMFKKIGAEAKISGDIADLEKADKLLLPGVGAFDHGMEQLAQKNLIPVLNEKVLRQQVPVLGICLGMQLLSRSSEEGRLNGLGWINGDTKRFQFSQDAGLKVPHMGWNTFQPALDHPLFAGMTEELRFYFVHSYHLICDSAQEVLGTTHYGYPFTAAVHKGNIMGVQFHPEKSHKFGMKLLQNFNKL